MKFISGLRGKTERTKLNHKFCTCFVQIKNLIIFTLKPVLFYNSILNNKIVRERELNILQIALEITQLESILQLIAAICTYANNNNNNNNNREYLLFMFISGGLIQQIDFRAAANQKYQMLTFKIKKKYWREREIEIEMK